MAVFMSDIELKFSSIKNIRALRLHQRKADILKID